jgi:phosphopantetheine--protein transferase-like protein
METETRDRLRRAVADFFEVDAAAVGPAFPLTARAGQGSIARAALDSMIRRRVGVRAKSVYTASTFGELESELGGEGEAPAEPGSTPAAIPARREPRPPEPSATGGLVACGVDIEQIDDLPKATDYWEDAFYRANFTPAEISYCLLQESPPHHFAARWCAKEALKKCDAAFLAEEPNRIEVASEPSGAPYLVHRIDGHARRLPHALSLSHTTTAAVAMVVMVGMPTLVPASVAPVTMPDLPPAAPRSPRAALLGLTLLTLVNLGLAAFALWKATGR